MSTFCRQTYEGLIGQVDKPARYLGNERGAVRKDLRSVAVHFALAFPEVYEIAQSHPGLQILYDLLNRRPDVYAERVYAPWLDMEALLRRHRQPVVSLETFTPLSEFGIVGFSLQYELTYTNLLMMLDLGGIPLLAAERTAQDPLIVAGGPCAFNPEPLADFLDAVLLGDGESAVGELCDVYAAWDGRDRAALLDAVSTIRGIYVPAHYQAEYRGRRLRAVSPARAGVSAMVEKRIETDLNAVPLQETFVVPNMKVVHARPSLEVMRGCVKGCRFCQAGYIYRPLRERDPHRVLAQAERAVAATGTEELSLLSLSTGDYSCVNPVLTALMNRFAADRVALSLPSTRVDALASPLLDQIRRVRKTGFTLAPEAGSQRMRDVIQKEYQEDELIDAARQIFRLGWRSLKLYFMLGLPGETEADLVGIADLSAKVAATGSGRCEVTASVSTFVPKPHTPFQWAAQIDMAQIEARQALLRRELQKRRVRFKWHDPRASFLEGIFSRGDRRLGALLLRAYDLGCRFDGWTESCRLDLWEQACRETGIDPNDYLRRRHLDEVLPWDHLSSGVTKAFLQRELARAVEGRLTPDCSVERCTYCGACDFTTVRNIDFHLTGAKGTDHRGEMIDNWAQITVDAGSASGSWEPRGWKKIHGGLEDEGARTAGNVHHDGAPRNGANAAAATPYARGETGLANAEEWLSAGTEALTPPTSASPRTAVRRVRLVYRKVDRARFVSMLDLIDIFARACRRARLPIAYSQGHHVKPRFRFGPALPVGAESECEFLDLDLTEALEPADVGAALGRELPEGLAIVGAEEISLRAPGLETALTSTRYRIDVRPLQGADGGTWIDRRFADFVSAASFRMRKHSGAGEKEIDARPLVDRLERVDADTAELEVRFTPEGSVKPSDLLAAVLGLDPPSARALPIRKTACFFRSGDAAAPPDLLTA